MSRGKLGYAARSTWHGIHAVNIVFPSTVPSSSITCILTGPQNPIIMITHTERNKKRWNIDLSLCNDKKKRGEKQRIPQQPPLCSKVCGCWNYRFPRHRSGFVDINFTKLDTRAQYRLLICIDIVHICVARGGGIPSFSRLNDWHLSLHWFRGQFSSWFFLTSSLLLLNSCLYCPAKISSMSTLLIIFCT